MDRYRAVAMLNPRPAISRVYKRTYYSEIAGAVSLFILFLLCLVGGLIL